METETERMASYWFPASNRKMSLLALSFLANCIASLTAMISGSLSAVNLKVTWANNKEGQPVPSLIDTTGLEIISRKGKANVYGDHERGPGN